ncbi:NAD(P)/FAD-dependent oxidoreductase [soil metagenome]
MATRSSPKLRIGIVGAGTAGLASAIAFARLGHTVQVFEKHAALATLGAGLLIQPQGVAAISELGLREEFESISVPIDRLHGQSHRNWTLLDIEYQSQPARAVTRHALAHMLLARAEANGVDLLYGTNIEQIDVAGAMAVACSATNSTAYDLVVIADGAASVLPEQAGMAVSSTPYAWGALWAMFDVENWPHERVLAQRFQGTRQMFGLMPTQRSGDKLRLSLFWSLRCDAYQDWKAGSLSAWKDQMLALWPESLPVVSQLVSHDQMTFASYHHAWSKRLANPPICMVGDAAHAMSPQLGLGATLAVQDALCLARQVDALGPRDGPLAYCRQRRFTVRAYQTLSRALTPCFQADGNGLWRDLLFATGSKIPGVPWLMRRGLAEPQSS